MYLPVVNKEIEDSLYWDLMEIIRKAVEERGCRPATEEQLTSWIGLATMKLQEGWTVANVVSQVKLYRTGVSDARISDFMTILPFS